MADVFKQSLLQAARPTFMDRLVGVFSPEKAVARSQSRVTQALVGEYAGGSPVRRSMRSWFTWETSGNAVNAGALRLLRSRSRDLNRNNPIGLGAVNAVVTNVVGEGLTLNAQVNRKRLGLADDEAESWEAKAEEEFALACRNLDFLGTLSWGEIQALVMRQTLEAGDLLAVRRRDNTASSAYKLRIQLIEAERLSNPENGANTPTMIDGVQVDSDGRPTGYSICNTHPTDINMGEGRKWTVYDRGNTITGTPLILHLFDKRRVDQNRGVPYLAPVIEMLKQLGDYTEAELRASVVNALFTVFVKRPAAAAAGDQDIVGSSTEGNIDPNTELAMGSGAVIDLADGEEIQVADPKRPNAAAQVFVELMAKEIGVALELPFEVLMKSFDSSYSASRAALEMAWQFFSHRRAWLAARFCQPVYEWVITEAIINGRIQAPGFFKDEAVRAAWLGAEWVGASRIQLDPYKEASADLIDINMGAKTIEQVCVQRTGGSFETKHAQRAKEQRMRVAAGLVTPTTAGAAQQMALDDNSQTGGTKGGAGNSKQQDSEE